MSSTKLKKQIRQFDLFCYLNSCRSPGSCDPETIYLLLAAIGEEGSLEKPPPNLPSHWTSYLNNTHYSVIVGYSHPYFYCLGYSWRRYHIVTVAWAERIAKLDEKEWKRFSEKLSWCHPFPVTLAFLTATAYRHSTVKVKVNHPTKWGELSGKEKTIDGLLFLGLMKEDADATYVTVVQRTTWLQNKDTSVSYMEISGDGRNDFAEWLLYVLLLTCDSIPHQLPGRNRRSVNSSGKSLS